MSSRRLLALMIILLTTTDCAIDDRVLSQRDGRTFGGATSLSCGGTSNPGCASVAGSGQLPSSCSDLNENGILDKVESIALNPAFDSDSDDWDTEVGIGIVWNPLDACGSARSGSLNMTYQKSAAVAGSDSAASVQCVPVEAGRIYAISALFYPRSVGSLGQTGVAFFSSVNCTGPHLEVQQSPALATTGTWSATTVKATAPEGALSLQLRLLVGRNDWLSTQEQADVLVDTVLVEIVN